jgi:hypothetical protein
MTVKLLPAIVVCVLFCAPGDRLAPPTGVYYDIYNNLPRITCIRGCGMVLAKGICVPQA